MKLKLTSIAIVLTFLALLSGCVTQPVLNLNNVNIPVSSDGKQPSFDKVQTAIIKACKDRGWAPTIKEKGLVDAGLRIRRHHAEVSIKFDTTMYSIKYVSSENLNYGDGEIHRNYNKWITMLSNTIQKELGVSTQTEQ
jgi:hypothetical protein